MTLNYAELEAELAREITERGWPDTDKRIDGLLFEPLSWPDWLTMKNTARNVRNQLERKRAL